MIPPDLRYRLHYQHPHPRRSQSQTDSFNTVQEGAILRADHPSNGVNIGCRSTVCVQTLRKALPEARIVVLTGFASIATAVEAIKLGADHYLAKPSNTDDIEAAFAQTRGDVDAPVDGRRSSIKTLEWEDIHQTLLETDFNISEAARRLGLHRRTLARKLEKRQLR
jgi:two-component system response regulator RegA